MSSFTEPTLLRAATPVPESARPYGMGNAFSAVANDSSAILYNPAGLALVRQMEVAGTGGRLLSGGLPPRTDFSAMGALPLTFFKESWNHGTLAAILSSSGKSGDDTVVDLGTSVGVNMRQVIPKWFARMIRMRIPDGLYGGSSLRIRRINRAGDGGSDMGLGMDMGLLYRFRGSPKYWRDGWTVALAVQEMNTGAISTPVLYRLGTAWRYHRYTFGLDLVAQGSESDLMPGVEVSLFKKLIRLRAGSGKVPGSARQFVMGAGFFLPPLQIDFAYGLRINKLTEQNDRFLVSLTYRFGVPLIEQYLEDQAPEEQSKSRHAVTNLELRRTTLKEDLRQKKQTFKEVDSDLRHARESLKQTNLEIKKAAKDLDLRKNEIQELWKELRILQIEKMEVEKQIEEAKPRPPGKVKRLHRVVEKDSLRGLALKYYGDPTLWKIIYDANEDRIIRGTPKIGEDLIIP